MARKKTIVLNVKRENDDIGQLVSDSEKNDKHPTADVIDEKQCSSAQRKGLINIAVDGSGNDTRVSEHSDIAGQGRNTEPAAVIDNSENTPRHNNSSVCTYKITTGRASCTPNSNIKKLPRIEVVVGS